MRLILLSLMLGAVVWGQTMTEFGAAAAGGVTGGVAGKKVSDGLTNILDKIDQQTTAAAASPTPSKPAVAAAPLLIVGPGVPAAGAVSAGPSIDGTKPPRVARAAVAESVPPPPPLPHATVAMKPIEPIRTQQPVLMAVVPPPPPVTIEDLSALSKGQSREEVMKLGQPASRITMDDDGHLLEIFRYMSQDATFGVVRLIDGAVSSVDLRR